MNALQMSKRALWVFIVSISAIVISLGTAFAIVFSQMRANAYTSDNQSGNIAEVGELWNGSNFDQANSTKLIRMLSNSVNGSIDMITSNINASTNTIKGVQASTLRGYTYGKSANQSIVVTLGGQKWIVMFLSQAKGVDKDSDGTNDLIATLWQLDAGVVSNSTFGNSSSYYGANNDTGYPTAMYGTSYIRAVTLNNGGSYLNITSNSNPTSIGLSATASSSHTYASYTHSSSALRAHLVQPQNVSWQESGQSAKTYTGIGYNLSNENWSKSITDDGFYSAKDNYADKTNSDAWKTDYLWLPSLSETGYNDTYSGIWGTNQNERSNSQTYAWSRSSYYNFTYFAYVLYADGSSYTDRNVSNTYAVRPALHLNLNSVALRATKNVGFNAQGGSETASVEVLKNEAMPSITPPTKLGYKFSGFYTGTNGSGDKYYEASGASARTYPASGGPSILYAYWVPIGYTISFDSNGGQGSMNDMSLKYGENTNLLANAYTKEGYEFGGWATLQSSPLGEVEFFDKQSISNLVSTEGAQIVLYAQWVAITYQVKYNGNGNSGGSMANSTHTYDIEKTLTANGYTLAGHYLQGWATSEGGPVVYTNGQVVKNLSSLKNDVVNLYARWAPNEYTVTFNYNGATGENGVASKKVTYGNFYSDLPLPTKAGSAFAGWYLENNFVTLITSTTAVSRTADHTLYAKWVAWLEIVVSGTNQNYTAETMFNQEINDARVNVHPTAGHWVQQISFDNTTWTTIQYYETDFFDVDFGVSLKFTASTKNNSVCLEFKGIYSSYIAGSTIKIYLKTTNQAYSSLRAPGGASVMGVAVSSTMGGMASILGDPYGEEPTPGEQITLVAKLTDSGYEFLGWCLPANLSAPIYTEMSVRVDKADLIGQQLVAVFVPVSNSNVNTDLNN